MRPLDALVSAVEAILASKLRSLLATLGIVIGIAAVSTLISFGQGFRRFATAQMAQGDAGTLVLVAQSPSGEAAIRLNDDDLQVIERLPNVGRVAAESTGFGDMQSATGAAQVEIVGVRADYVGTSGSIVLGRWFTPDDERDHTRVAVLTVDLAWLLFPDGQAIGQRVVFRGAPLQVIGIYQPARASSFAGELRIFVPLSTARERGLVAGGAGTITQATIFLEDPLAAGASADEIRQTLRARHNLRPEQADTFTLHDFRAQAEINERLLGGITLLLGGIGGIALLVGGIGIMNIMLVSVSERTQEIGLRKAVGARRRDILLQFLFESIALSLAGGILGLLVSLLLIRTSALVLVLIAEQYELGRALQLDPTATLLGLTFAALVGILAGSYPAHQASKLHPIVALRSGR